MDSVKSFTVTSLFSGIGGLDLGFIGDITVHRDSVASLDWIEEESSTKRLCDAQEDTVRIKKFRMTYSQERKKSAS